MLHSTVQPMDLPGVRQVSPGEGQRDRHIRVLLGFPVPLPLATKGYWDTINAVYPERKNYIPEPKNKGLSAAMNTFYYAAMRRRRYRQARGGTRRRCLSGLVKAARSPRREFSDTIITRLRHLRKNLNQQV